MLRERYVTAGVGEKEDQRLTERVFERANRRDGAEGSLVHQAQSSDDVLHLGTVPRLFKSDRRVAEPDVEVAHGSVDAPGAPVDLHRRQVPRPASRRRRLAGDRASVHRGDESRTGMPLVRVVAQRRGPRRVRPRRSVRQRGCRRRARNVRTLPRREQDLPPHLAETPRIVNAVVPGTEWSLLGELAVDVLDCRGSRSRRGSTATQPAAPTLGRQAPRLWRGYGRVAVLERLMPGARLVLHQD